MLKINIIKVLRYFIVYFIGLLCIDGITIMYGDILFLNISGSIFRICLLADFLFLFKVYIRFIYEKIDLFRKKLENVSNGI